MSRRSRFFAVIAALAVVQLALVGAWRWKFAKSEARLELAAGEAVPAKPAPALSLERADGSTTELASLAAGRPVLVHFWATWCPPCREELPQFLAFGREYSDIAVVAVSVNDDWAAVRDFLPREGLAATLRCVRKEELAAWNTNELPETWLVTADRRVVWRWRGAQEWAAESAELKVREALLARH